MVERESRLKERNKSHDGDQSAGRKERNEGAFFLIVGGDLATLCFQLLTVCCFGGKRIASTHSPDLILNYCIPSGEYLQLHADCRDEEDEKPDGCLIPFRPPCGSQTELLPLGYNNTSSMCLQESLSDSFTLYFLIITWKTTYKIYISKL